MALNQLFNSPLLSGRPKLRQNKISAAKISPLKSFKIDTDVLRAPSIPGPGEGVKEPNLILRELVETNTILREVQKQLAIDFANRILEKEKDLKLQKSLLSKRRAKDEEDSLEKINKNSSFLKKSFDKVTKPVIGIFDRIKDFLTALALAITASAAFDWLKDPANREKLENFFNWVGEHWKWIVGIIAGGLLLKGLLDILGAIGGIAALAKGLGLGSGLRRIGTGLMDCFGVLACAPKAAVVLSSAFFTALTSALMIWPWLKGLKDRVFEIPDWVKNPIPNPALAIAKIQEVVDGIKTKVGDLATDVANVTAGVFSGSVLDALASEMLQRFITNPAIATRAWVTSMVDATMTQAKKTWSQIVGIKEAVQLYLKERLTAVGEWLQAWEPPKIEVDWNDLGGKLEGLAWTVVGILFKDILGGIGKLLLGDLLPAAAKGGTVSDILARQEFAKGGPVRKKKPCCKSCMGFSAGKFEEGGKTKGPSHAQGGIPIEVEGGEFITKASSVNPLTEPLLRDINDNGARMWTAFAGAVEKQGQNNLKQMEINNDFSDFLKKYRDVAGINPGVVHGMGGPDPETPLKLKPFSSSTLTTGEQVPSELLELGTIWKDGILRHKETDKPFTYADLYKIIDSRVSNLSGDQIKVIPHRSTDANQTLRRDRATTTIVNDTQSEQAIPISRPETPVESVQKRGSRGTDVVIQTYDADNEWILATMSAYDITGYVGTVI